MGDNYKKFVAEVDSFRTRLTDLNDQININRAQYATASGNYDQAVLSNEKAAMDEHEKAMVDLDAEYGRLSHMTALLSEQGPAASNKVQAFAQSVYKDCAGDMKKLGSTWITAMDSMLQAQSEYLALVAKAGAVHAKATRLINMLNQVREVVGNNTVPWLNLGGTMDSVNTKRGRGPIYLDTAEITKTFKEAN